MLARASGFLEGRRWWAEKATCGPAWKFVVAFSALLHRPCRNSPCTVRVGAWASRPPVPALTSFPSRLSLGADHRCGVGCARATLKMASRSLLLLALAAFAASASAQSIQSGLLYWCSFAENGPNMAGVAANQPRTYWQGVNANPPQFASVCHFGNRQTDNVVYTFSNGTAYPANIPTSNYAVAPSTCQVRAPHMPSIHPSRRFWRRQPSAPTSAARGCRAAHARRFSNLRGRIE